MEDAEEEVNKRSKLTLAMKCVAVCDCVHLHMFSSGKSAVVGVCADANVPYAIF